MGIIRRQYRKQNKQQVATSYRAEVYVKGFRVSAKTFSTKREAVLWHEKEKQKYSLDPASLNDRMLFRDCVDKYWEDIQSRRMKSTTQGYESRLTYLYSGPLASIKMAEY